LEPKAPEERLEALSLLVATAPFASNENLVIPVVLSLITKLPLPSDPHVQSAAYISGMKDLELRIKKKRKKEEKSEVKNNLIILLLGRDIT
jgi:hypothetical protein